MSLRLKRPLSVNVLFAQGPDVTSVGNSITADQFNKWVVTGPLEMVRTDAKHISSSHLLLMPSLNLQGMPSVHFPPLNASAL